MKNLTNGMIFYSSALSAFEKLDFRSDALAGVRSNYFSTNKQTQADETEINIQNQFYKLSYKMVENHTLSWKVTKNQRPYQAVKRETGGIYCVKYYDEDGNVYKRQYFDINHYWIKTEYYDKDIAGYLVCTISPKLIQNIIVLEKVTFDDNIIKNIELLFPSETPPQKVSDALVYTSLGMIWYDKSFKPANFDDLYEAPYISNTFGISENLFEQSYQPKNKLDFTKLAYLGENIDEMTAEDIANEIKEIVSDENTETPANIVDTPQEINEEIKETEVIADTTEENQDIVSENSYETEQNCDTTEEPTYSAYDRIEKILAEASKSNKNLFGEVLEFTDAATTNDDIIDQNAENENEQVSEELIDLILSEVSEMDKTTEEADADEETTETEIPKIRSSKPRHFAPDDNSTQSDDYEDEDEDEVNIESADDEEAYFAEILKKKEMEALEKAEAYQIKQKQLSEYLVETQSGVYSYYGETDENGKRTGRGRTESPDGFTAYDGGYNNDKRDGFGVFYYKNGDINYVGEWSQNKRNGCGVGYRTSDGTMHIGKWADNKPEDIGARFDKSGNFIDVANYTDGVKHGKCISIDENGNFVISVWENGEKVSEYLLDDILN